MAEELWKRLGHGGTLAYEPWPEFDPALLVEDTLEIPVQVNGKIRARIQIAAGADRDTLEAAAREAVADHLAEGTVRKAIVVPDKLVNFVVN